ncbi:MAG: AEC family transporter [Bifidobacteriaceae bacterium]|jgi:predicted permease|nr:AEC family transporter [Bifidobacteriaceae bacterium]
MGAIVQPLALLAIIVAGYGLKRSGMVKPTDYRVLQKIVFTFTLPGAIIYSFSQHKPEVSLLWISLFGLCCALLPLPILFLASKNQKIRDRFFLMLNASGFNVGNFCFPVLQALMGAGAVLPAVMFDIGNSFMLSATTNALTSTMLGIPPDKPLDQVVGQDEFGNEKLLVIKPTDKDARRLARHSKVKAIAKSYLSSVSFDVYVVMIVLMCVGIAIPTAVGNFVQPVAVANSFCSMLMVGMLMDVPASHKDTKQVGAVFVWRLAFSVLFCLVAWFLLPFDLETRKVLVIVGLAPTPVFATLFTDRVLGNARLAGFCLAATAVVSLALMTIFNIIVPS